MSLHLNSARLLGIYQHKRKHYSVQGKALSSRTRDIQAKYVQPVSKLKNRINKNPIFGDHILSHADQCNSTFWRVKSSSSSLLSQKPKAAGMKIHNPKLNNYCSKRSSKMTDLNRSPSRNSHQVSDHPFLQSHPQISLPRMFPSKKAQLSHSKKGKYSQMLLQKKKVSATDSFERIHSAKTKFRQNAKKGKKVRTMSNDYDNGKIILEPYQRFISSTIFQDEVTQFNPETRVSEDSKAKIDQSQTAKVDTQISSMITSGLFQRPKQPIFTSKSHRHSRVVSRLNKKILPKSLIIENQCLKINKIEEFVNKTD